MTGVRRAAAKLIGGTPADIALVKNTSEGIATIAMGFDWRAGDKIVAFEEEFPANYYPWKRLEANGVKVEWLSVFDPLEKIDAACRGRAVAGHQLRAVFERLSRGSGSAGRDLPPPRMFLRGGCHSGTGRVSGGRRAGAESMRSRRTVTSGCSGPEGCGVLYIDAALREHVAPVEFGYTNVARYTDYGTRDMTLRPDAGRYECGTLNTIGCYGLRAAIEFVLEVGVERIAPAVQALGDRMAAAVESKGYEVRDGARRRPEPGS